MLRRVPLAAVGPVVEGHQVVVHRNDHDDNMEAFVAVGYLTAANPF